MKILALILAWIMSHLPHGIGVGTIFDKGTQDALGCEQAEVGRMGYRKPLIAAWAILGRVQAVLMGVLEVRGGKGTIFGPFGIDPLAGGPWACEGRLRGLGCCLAVEELVVASKSLPCGTIIMICSVRGEMCSLAVVADYGPKNATLDVWHVLARKIHHDGEGIMWFVENET